MPIGTPVGVPEGLGGACAILISRGRTRVRGGFWKSKINDSW
jgi:hypothetical protein